MSTQLMPASLLHSPSTRHTLPGGPSGLAEQGGCQRGDGDRAPLGVTLAGRLTYPLTCRSVPAYPTVSEVYHVSARRQLCPEPETRGRLVSA